MDTARHWLERIRALPLPPKIRIMNVCGGHERSIAAAGLRTALPEQIELIAGPGCPVCICPEEDVYEAIQLALQERVVLLAFGDMLRVPVNVPRSEPRSLEQAKAAGADIRPIASPLEAVRIAETERDRTVVLFATGFETTTAPVAAMLVANPPANLFVLLSGRLTWPAVAMLLESGDAAFDALVAPGHVATVMGPEEWRFVPEQHDMPAAIAGFRPDTLLAATYSVLRQHLEGRAFLDNCYGEVVREGGNPVAREFLARTMDVVDANWRGIGIIPRSGFAINGLGTPPLTGRTSSNFFLGKPPNRPSSRQWIPSWVSGFCIAPGMCRCCSRKMKQTSNGSSAPPIARSMSKTVSTTALSWAMHRPSTLDRQAPRWPRIIKRRCTRERAKCFNCA